jgi:peptidoglycan-associated lipoprotein
MRATTSLRLLWVAVPALLAACSSTPVQAPPPPPPAPAPAPAAAPAAQPTPAPAAAALPAYLDPNSPIYQKRSVYFDFDESKIKPEYTPVVESHGHYLAENAALHVRVEGNTDERGSSEYNLALGQRRAEAVKSALEVYGAKDAQIEAVSFGKERPKATGHDEAAWAQNRRADIVYPSK